MVTFELEVNRRNIFRYGKKFPQVGDTVNYVRFHFTFRGKAWKDTTRTAVFKSRSFNITRQAYIDQDGYCFVPEEILATYGTVLCSVYGVVVENDEVVTRITTDPVDVLFIKDSIHRAPGGPSITPTEYESFIAEVRSRLDNLKTSDLTNDLDFPSDADYVHTDNNYTDEDQNKLNSIEEGAQVNVNADWAADSGDAEILNKPTIPEKTSDLLNDSGFIFEETDPVFSVSPASNITSEDIAKWDTFDNVQSDWNEADSTDAAYIKNKPTIPTQPSDIGAQEALVSGTNIKTINNMSLLGNGNIDIQGGGGNVQSDWNQTDNTADDYIKNKPTIPSKRVWYGTSSSLSDASIKVVTTLNSDFVLSAGNIVYVKFNHDDSYGEGLQLNIDGTGAKPILLHNPSINTYKKYIWVVGEVVPFIYDGDNYLLVKGGLATTLSYGLTKLSNSTSSTSTSVAATPKAVKTAYDLAASKDANVQSDWNQTDNTADDYIKNKPISPVVVVTYNGIGAADAVFDAIFAGQQVVVKYPYIDSGGNITDIVYCWFIEHDLSTMYYKFSGVKQDGTLVQISLHETGVWSYNTISLISTDPPFKVKMYQWASATYNGDSTTWVYSLDKHPEAVSGYTAVGVLQGTPDSGGNTLLIQISINQEAYGDRFLGFVRNVGLTAQTTTLALPVLYIRNDLL